MVQIAQVDVVERVPLKRPLVLGIVDLELAIRRHPLRLHAGNVGANNGGGRVLVRKVNRPDAGAGADVEHFLHVGGDGC